MLEKDLEALRSKYQSGRTVFRLLPAELYYKYDEKIPRTALVVEVVGSVFCSCRIQRGLSTGDLLILFPSLYENQREAFPIGFVFFSVFVFCFVLDTRRILPFRLSTKSR